MANKTFQGRIQMKNDTSANWAKATTFVPLKGEIIIYTDLNQIKVGDGTTTVSNLSFIDDVYTESEIETLYNNTLPLISGSSEVSKYDGTVV